MVKIPRYIPFHQNFIQVVTYTHAYFYDPFMLVSPLPKKYRSYFALLKPLSLGVWIGVVISLLCIPLALTFIARKEMQMGKETFNDWKSLDQSFWYAFSTLVGESITRTLNFRGSYAIRLELIR